MWSGMHFKADNAQIISFVWISFLGLSRKIISFDKSQ